MDYPTLLMKLKRRLEIVGDDEDELLEDILESATALYLTTRYGSKPYPVDDDDKPLLDMIQRDWIVRASVEMYQKIGIEGQISSTENTVTRSFESGSISRSLMQEIVPLVGIAR